MDAAGPAAGKDIEFVQGEVEEREPGPRRRTRAPHSRGSSGRLLRRHAGSVSDTRSGGVGAHGVGERGRGFSPLSREVRRRPGARA